MKNFLKIFNKVGGKTILKQYWHAGVFFYALWMALMLGFSKKSLEILRLAVSNKVLKKLRKKYTPFIREYKQGNMNLGERKQSNKVWVFWMQGLETAPPLVQACFSSLQLHLKDKEIILLTENNYRNYVSFPEHIQKKVDNGTITLTHFSDILRLALLLQYGGTWIDATVFCSDSNFPSYFFESDLFVFQTLKPGLDGQALRISSWFMSASSNHPILKLTQSLLYHYWEKKQQMVDYFLLHQFFELAIEAYPEEWKKVPSFSNALPHMLFFKLFEQFEAEEWERIKKQCSFHKLSYKNIPSIIKEDSYFDRLFTR